MNETQENFSVVFYHLEGHKCLCNYSAIDFWYQIYQKSFNKSDSTERTKDQLLCIAFKRLIGEIYTSSAHGVCKSIHQLFEIFSSEDMWMAFSLCVLLSQHWVSFMKQFYEVINSRTENPSLNRFLLLWQKLIDKCLGQDLLNVYLNEQFVIGFLCNAYNVDVISLRIYADIIMQFYISNLKMKPLQESHNCLEEAVISALDKDFLNLLPCDFRISGFCILTISSASESSSSSVSHFQKCDTIIVKKVAFILLNIFTNLENKQSIGNAVMKVFNFVKKNFDVSSEKPVYRWILSVFIDQDDILFGIMLALLRIYLIFKGDTTNSPEYTQLQNSLNPHEIFISFLQKIGFDHNELLSFLLSNETCILLYLLQYLKLLLQESDAFNKAHRNIIKTDLDVFNSDLEDSSMGETSKESYISPAKKLLVSYSSSSSEDDFIPFNQIEAKSETVSHQTNYASSSQDKFIVIETLIKLKQAVKKLVDEGEFPYNITPLVILLETCENHFLSF